MDQDSAELAQISFYLGKEASTFDSVLDPESGLREKKTRTFDFDVDEAKCRFIYFEALSSKTNPPWLDFVNEKLEAASRIQFSAKSHSPNGLLLINLQNRIFATAFGRSAGACLYRKALEPDFGIKTAMNMCGNEEIRQTKSQSNAVTVTHIDRQVAKPSEAFAFGLSEAEELRYISAHMRGNRNITLQGRDSLTLKVIGEKKLNWLNLIDQCKTFLKKYQSRDYIKLFPNYRNFRLATDAEAEVLDQALLKVVKEKDFGKLQLCIPEFLTDDMYSFSYTNHTSRDNKIYAYLDVSQLTECLDLEKVTIEKLHRKNVYAYSHEDNRVLDSMRWPLYDCLIFEHEIKKKYFILTGGRWSQVDPDFYNAIIKFVRDNVREEPCEKKFTNINISDDRQRKNLESIFNKRVVEIRPSCILFDRAKLRIGLGKKDKEFCDVLDLEDDGVIRIINAKQHKDASSTNYLFSQAKLYSDAFLHDETFLSEIRSHIAESECRSKKKYLDYISDVIGDLRGEDYRVCLWVLYNRKEKKPEKSDISLIAQYELKLMHDHLRKTCKFKDIILRFVPVEIKQYTRIKSPH